MKTKTGLFILVTIILGVFLFLLFSGEFRAEKLECPSPCPYPTTPNEINGEVILGFSASRDFQPLHINMDNNEHYVILAKAETRGSLITGLHFLLYNAKNTFYTIDAIKEPTKDGDTLDISLTIKRSSFFGSQVQSPIFVPLPAGQLNNGDLIDIHLPDITHDETSEIGVFASEVEGHICTSRVME